MSDETKIVITLKGTAATVGIQRTNCDPAFFKGEDSLAAVLGAIPIFFEEAKRKWEANPRYPKSKLPPAAPVAPQPRQPAAPAAPKVNEQRPML